MATFGWKLDRADRAALLEQFLPAWPDVIADHVTLPSEGRQEEGPPAECKAQIVGKIDDGTGLQALVVAIDGSTRRLDGSTFHITWSLDKDLGRKAVESNRVLADLGWLALGEAVPIRLIPARLDDDPA